MASYSNRALPSGGPSKAVAVDELELDARCQARDGIRSEIVDEYAELYAAKFELPPIDVFDVSGKMFIVDGFHRLPAAMKAGLEFIRCKVVGKGTAEDAAWHATGVNQSHGIRRTNRDKRRAVQLALESEIGQEQSSRVIAKHVGVSPDFVSRLRAEIELSSDDSREGSSTQSTTVVGEDGKRRAKRRPSAKLRPSSETKAEPESDDVQGDDGADDRRGDHEVAAMPEEGELYRKAAAAVQRARAQVSDLVEDQTADKALEDAWRRLSDMSTVACGQCKGPGCKWCDSHGWITKKDARSVRERLRSLKNSKTARGRS